MAFFRDLMGRRSSALAVVIALSAGLNGCEQTLSLGGPNVAAVPANQTASLGESPRDVKYFPSDEPRKLGYQRFKEGNFGLAEHYFQDAVARAPKDVHAWIGLAASYDRLARFDLADRAYKSAIKLTGETPQILNNQGYSYMLRSDLGKARDKFQKALRAEPDNQTIVDNLAMLAGGTGAVDRQND